MTTSTKLELALHDLSVLMNRIRSQHKMMRAFAKNHNDLEQVTLEHFVQATVSHDGIGDVMEHIHSLVVGSDDLKNLGNVGVLTLLANNFEVNQLVNSGKYINNVVMRKLCTRKVIRVYRFGFTATSLPA